MGHSPVMLSAAKHLAVQRERPFAALGVTVVGSISSTSPDFAKKPPDKVGLFA
jgi:hypothetical protein